VGNYLRKPRGVHQADQWSKVRAMAKQTRARGFACQGLRGNHAKGMTLVEEIGQQFGITKERVPSCHEAAARLPDELRAVFDLLWYQEMSQTEDAALLGITRRSVKLRWTKARLQVQQALSGSPFDEPGSPD
jgi:DNA-directed RNA polymerase specialized sigma24 family protein